jgi:Domain of unknown function (DUF4203)
LGFSWPITPTFMELLLFRSPSTLLYFLFFLCNASCNLGVFYAEKISLHLWQYLLYGLAAALVILGCVLGYFLHDHILIFSTSFCGGYGAIWAIGLYLPGFPNPFEMAQEWKDDHEITVRLLNLLPNLSLVFRLTLFLTFTPWRFWLFSSGVFTLSTTSAAGNTRNPKKRNKPEATQTTHSKPTTLITNTMTTKLVVLFLA